MFHVQIYYARCIILLFTSFSHIAFCEADSSLSASCASYPSPAGWQRSRVVQHYLCSSCPDCSDSADCSYSGCSCFCRSCSCLYSDLCSDCLCPCFYPFCSYSYRFACSASGFEQFLAEGKIISGCIVLRIAAQGVLITSYGLRILLMLLHDHTHIVVTSGASHLVRFQFRSILKLYHCHRILLLHHQGATQIIDSLRILLVLGDSLAILRFGCSPLLFMIGAVSLADEVAVVLRSHLRQAQHHQGKTNIYLKYLILII